MAANTSISRSPRFRSTHRTASGPSTRIGTNLAGRKLVVRTAEFAGDQDLAVFHHVIAIGLGKAFQHSLDTVARARALRAQWLCTENPNARLMKKPVHQPLAGQRRIDQLDVLDGGYQGLAFNPGLVHFHLVWRNAVRRIAWIEVGDTRAFMRLRQKLQHDATCPPAMRRAIGASAQFLRDSKAYLRRDLLRAEKILVRDALQ